MVDTVKISGKEGKLKGQLARAIAKLKKAKLGGNPNEIRAAELRVKKLQKFGTKAKVGKSKKGDSPSMPSKPETLPGQTSMFDPKKGVFADIWKKKKVKEDYPVEADDWWEDDEDPDWWKAKPEFGQPPGALGGRPDLPQGFKHGGRINKAKKRKSKPKPKRAALRGHRAELRGG
jgi:hypothetical protein